MKDTIKKLQVLRILSIALVCSICFTVSEAFAAPIASFISTAPTCAGSAVNFTNTGSSGAGYSYTWDFGQGAAPATSISENPAGVVYNTSGNKIVTFSIFDGSSIHTVTQTITILDAPIAGFLSTAPQCTGLTVDFTNTGTVTGTAWLWNFGAGAIPATSTSQSPTGIVYSTAGTKVVTLSTTNTTTGCSVTVSQTININQTPIANFTSTAPTCAGSAVNLSNTGSTGGSWSYHWDLGQDAIPATSISENPVGVVYNTGGTKTVTFTIADGICTKTITDTITILNTPVANFSSTAPQCTGLTVDFINIGTVTGTTWVWNFGAGAMPATSTIQTPTGIVYATAGTKVISLTTTNTTTGCVDTQIQTININQTPTASFTSTAPMCAESAVNLSNTGSTGGNWSYFWDLGQDAIPATSISENPIGVVYSAGGNKTVTLTIADGSCTQTSTQTISIYSLPIANAGLDTTICANTSVEIGSTAITDNTYSWFPASTLNNSTIANPVASPVAGVTQYIVTVSNTITGCLSADTMIVTMLDPLISYAGVDGEICRYDSIQIGAGLVTGQTYVWTQSAGLNGTTISNPIATPDSTTTYTVTVTRAGCTPVTDQVTIIVHPLPLANAGTDDTITVGSSAQLIATGGIQYSWSPPYGLSSIGIYNPIANPDTTIHYIVSVTDVFGCVNTDTVIIMVIRPSLWVPNAFTPNGDGKSDVFIVRGDGIRNFEFGIFNRWGEQIFFSKDLNTGWDGTKQATGDQLPEGAYVYYVKGNTSTGDPVDAKGLINLIR